MYISFVYFFFCDLNVHNFFPISIAAFTAFLTVKNFSLFKISFLSTYIANFPQLCHLVSDAPLSF